MINTFYHHLSLNDYFLKVSGKSVDPKKFLGGAHCIGCTFMAMRTSEARLMGPIIHTQIYTSNALNLQLPFALFGLTKTPNFVTFLSVGVPKRQEWSRVWTPIIPNSHVLVYVQQSWPHDWRIDSFVDPSEWIYLVIAISTFFILVLGIYGIVLFSKEVKEDRVNPDIVKKMR